jgi:putative transposase
MTVWLQGKDQAVNRKRVQRLMWLEAIYPKPRLSQRDGDHRIYPYLLRGLQVDRPNQVWAADITYIPMSQGFMYLVAVIDWYSRCVLSWRFRPGI